MRIAGVTIGAAARSRGRRPSTGPFTTVRGLLPLIVVSVFLLALPIFMLAVGAFRNAAPGEPALWSFDAFVRTYTDPDSYETLGNSVVLASSSTVIAIVVALVLAFLVTRTATPLRKLVTPAMVLVVALPPLFYAMSWGMLGNPKIGLLNTTWRSLTGLGDALFDANSWAGLILVVALKNAAFCYLLIIGPFRALDRSLEEAAQVSGAGRLRTIIGIDLVVLAPAITGVTALSFVIGLEAFDVPLFLGTPAGIEVFSTQIYGLIASRSPADYGAASAISLLLVAAVIGLVFLQWKILGRRNYTTVMGKSYRTEPWHIGPWRWVGAAFIVAYLLVAVILPLLQLVLGSLQPFFGGAGVYSLVNYQRLLTNPTTVAALRSTFLVAVVGGLAAMMLALTIVYAITHNESRLRRVLELLTWLPYAVPGVVLSLGLAWTYVTIPGLRQLYGSLLLVGLGLVVAATPIATRAIQPALIQINRELEEASRVSGAGAGRMVRDIVLPLIMPSFLSGWFVVAIVMSGNLAIPILLSSSLTPTVPFLVYQLHGEGQTAQAAALFVVMLAGLLAGLVIVSITGRVLGKRLGREKEDPRSSRPPKTSTRDPRVHRPDGRARGQPTRPRLTRGRRHPAQRKGEESHMRQKKMWWAIVPVLLLTVAGCAGGGTNAPTPGSRTVTDEQLLGGTKAAATMQDLYNAAIKAGKTTVTVYGPGEQDKVPVYKLFAERFPGITVTGVYLVGPDYASRLDGEFASGNHVADLVQAGDTSVAVQIGKGYFEPFVPVTAADLHADYQDGAGIVRAASAVPFGIMYNTNEIRAADAPKGWRGLLDPSLRGRMVSDNVTNFGAGFSTLSHIMWDGRLGDDFITKLAAQRIRFESQGAVAGAAVATGQFAVEPYYPLSFFKRDLANGAPVKFVFPTEGGVHLSPHFLSVIKGAPNPDAAKLLMTWLFSPEGQQATAAVGYYPLMPGQAGPDGYPAASGLDLFKAFPLAAVGRIAGDNLAKIKAAFK